MRLTGNQATQWFNEIKQFGRQIQYENLELYQEGVIFNNTTKIGKILSSDILKIDYSVDGDLLKTSMGELKVEIKNDSQLINEIKINRQFYYIFNFYNTSSILIGPFIITKIEEQKDKNSILVTSYDWLIKSMTDYRTPRHYTPTTDTQFLLNKTYYEKDNLSYYNEYTGIRTGNPSSLNLYDFNEITYPITLENYLIAIGNELGIRTLYTGGTNYNKQIKKEHYLDENNKSLGYTFRDILDDLAECYGRFIRIYDYGQYNPYIDTRLLNETNVTIDENYFSDKNVNIGEKYGPINKLTTNIGIPRQDTTSITNNGVCEIQILDNPILNQDNGDEFLDGIFNNIKGIEYYLNDFKSTGLCLFEIGDKYNVSIKGTTYPCVLLHDQIAKTTGLKENIYTKKPKQAETPYKYQSSIERSSRNAYIIADKTSGEIKAVVENIGDNGVVNGASLILAINRDGSSAKLEATKIDITANDILNLLAGNQINLTSKNITITSNNFSVDANGNLVCSNASITNGTISIEQAIGDNAIYTYEDDSMTNTRTETSLIPAGMDADIRDLSNNNIDVWASYYVTGIQLYNSGNRVYLDTSELSFSDSNNVDKFKVNGSTGVVTINNKGSFTFDVNDFGCLSLANVDANDYSTPGRYYFQSGCSNVPSNWVYIDVYGKGGATDTCQIAHSVGTNRIWIRARSSGVWHSWKELLQETSGTWTPTMANANVTYTKRTGTYKKVGSIVYFNCRLRGTINSTSSPYYAQITGLSFNPNDDYAGTLFEHLNCCVNDQNQLVRITSVNNQCMICLQRDNNGAGGSLAQWNTGLGTFYLSISGFFFVD